jgi:N-acetylglucosamine kinase-like BadF-type ATPase
MDYKKPDKFIIGVDSGGTCTDIRIKNLRTRLSREYSYPSTHYTTVGAKKFSDGIYKNIIHFTKMLNLDLKNCTGITIGGAGLRNPEQKTEVENIFRKKSKIGNVIAESDAYIALYDAYGEKDGIILISGTGSVLYARYKGQIERVGGWGNLFGDPGSGYYMGVMALNYIAIEYDIYGGKFRSDFSKEFEKIYGIKGENLIKKLYKECFSPSETVPLILELAFSGNKTASSIVDKTITGLLLYLDIFLGKKQKKEKFKLSFSGSLLSKKNIFSEKMKHIIKKEYKKRIILNGRRISPLNGAIKLIESTL